MNFLAIDVETANADYSSICQIGIAHVENGQIAYKWSTLVNPRAYFDPFNVSIHGIRKEDVKDAPTFDKIYQELSERISNQITVHHMPFDKTAISRACIENKLCTIDARWLDSAKIARRTWEQFAYKGYGLANLANFLRIDFEHHDALEDAITAAKVVIHACEKHQMSIEEWYKKISQPIQIFYGGSSIIHFEGNPEGSLYGETLVFTGTLSLLRREAAKIASDIGCHVDDSITKCTTILVVGTQDEFKLAGYEKSSKHRKAEELIQKGFPIKILTEKDFIEMCKSESKNLNVTY
jgi:DNA polymerase III subunit epsilon